MLVEESGVDAARLLLRKYNRDSGEWGLKKTGEFWDAVDLAHQQGRDGSGQRIAVIDSGFDLSIPAIRRQRCIWEDPLPTETNHGTAVALLILEVAPGSSLDLYPVEVGDHIDESLVSRALECASASGAAVINLSLGEPYPVETVSNFGTALDPATYWPDMAVEDYPFWVAERMRITGRWRALFTAPDNEIARAAEAATKRGCTVVAAAGNDSRCVFSPALMEGVFSASFMTPLRTLATGVELANDAPPTGYSQSRYSDFSVTQPAGVLGSSFAAPLISGFAATMPHRVTLSAHRDSVALAAVAGDLIPLMPDHSHGYSDRREGVLIRLYDQAVRSAPHPHYLLDDNEACPECSFFAAPAYIDGGLFGLNVGDLNGAETLLSAAALFAPHNPHAHANLGMTLAARANEAQLLGRSEEVVSWLKKALHSMTDALHLRPGYEPYAVRAHEFAIALENPSKWKLMKLLD